MAECIFRSRVSALGYQVQVQVPGLIPEPEPVPVPVAETWDLKYLPNR